MRKQDTEAGSRVSGCLKRKGKVRREDESPACPGYCPRVTGCNCSIGFAFEAEK